MSRQPASSGDKRSRANRKIVADGLGFGLSDLGESASRLKTSLSVVGIRGPANGDDWTGEYNSRRVGRPAMPGS
jgi:hypothetical protein